jgi:hypothetical protein
MVTVFGVVASASAMTSAPAAVSAQDKEPTGFLRTLDGLETAYARRYDPANEHDHANGIKDVSSEATPSGVPTPDRVTTTVLQFTDADAAAEAVALLQNDVAVGLVTGDHGATADDLEPLDLGDQAFLYFGEPDDDGELTGALVVLDGNLGIIVTANGPAASIEPNLMAFTGFMLDAEIKSDEVRIGEFANSTGDTFDLMPSADDSEVLNGPVPMWDYDLPIADSPIEATPGSRAPGYLQGATVPGPIGPGPVAC